MSDHSFFFLMIRRPPRSTLLSLHDALPISDLLLERAQGLVGGAAHGAHQRGAVLHERVRVLAGETLLQFHEGGRVGQAEQRSEEHTSELQSRQYLVCRLLLEKKNTHTT